MRKSLLLCLLALSFSSVGFAQSHGSKPLSDDDETALKQTQEMMRDQKQVQDYAAKNPGAAAADANLKNVLGPDTGEGYALSAEI